ncbi:MAG: hypothetical protein P3A33_02700 [Gemmatimonadota bacterium]|jgi:hypothetical protein|nr:hypothetical protein [Gemmatimonadota bacterium]
MPASRRFVLVLALLLPVVAAAALRHDLTGVWDFAVVTENGTGTPVVRMTQDGTTLTGTYESGRMGVRPISGSVVGDTIRFVLAAASEGGMALAFVGRVISPDLVRGEVDFQGMGSATFTGTRRKPTP